MLEKSRLLKILGMGLIATIIANYSSASYENNLLSYSRINKQEATIEKPTKINGKDLQKKIMEENLNTGKFSPRQVVEMLEGSIQRAGGLPKCMDEGIMYSFVDNESSWNPEAKSNKGARGLVQIRKKTWETYNPGVSYTKVYDPKENLEAAIKVINGHEEYFEKMHPNWENLPKREKLRIHAAAYNWGQGNLKKIDWNLNGKKRVPYETKKHIKKILETYDFLLS